MNYILDAKNKSQPKSATEVRCSKWGCSGICIVRILAPRVVSLDLKGNLTWKCISEIDFCIIRDEVAS